VIVFYGLACQMVASLANLLPETKTDKTCVADSVISFETLSAGFSASWRSPQRRRRVHLLAYMGFSASWRSPQRHHSDNDACVLLCCFRFEIFDTDLDLTAAIKAESSKSTSAAPAAPATIVYVAVEPNLWHWFQRPKTRFARKASPTEVDEDG
jgi:hypothetical protein